MSVGKRDTLVWSGGKSALAADWSAGAGVDNLKMWVWVEVRRTNGKPDVCAWAPMAALQTQDKRAIELPVDDPLDDDEAGTTDGSAPGTSLSTTSEDQRMSAAKLLKMAVDLLSPEHVKEEGEDHGYGVLRLWATHVYTDDNGWESAEDKWLGLTVSELRKKLLLVGWPKSMVEKVSRRPPPAARRAAAQVRRTVMKRMCSLAVRA